MGMVTGYDCYKAMTELEQRRWQREVIKHNNLRLDILKNKINDCYNVFTEDTFKVGGLTSNVLFGMSYHNFCDFIESSFTWSETKEGAEYWSNVCEKYKLHDLLNPGQYFKTKPPKTF